MKLEIQVTNISHNMSNLMVALESHFGPFDEFGRSILELESCEKLRDSENPKHELK